MVLVRFCVVGELIKGPPPDLLRTSSLVLVVSRSVASLQVHHAYHFTHCDLSMCVGLLRASALGMDS